MITAAEQLRELPVPPIVFGAFAFGILSLLLYVVIRLGRD